ncbi:MAG: hypothetical protein ACREIT_12515, partial [Tepidisphaeraceae bacterium]
MKSSDEFDEAVSGGGDGKGASAAIVSPNRRAPAAGLAGVVALWLGVQLLALALCATRVPFAARFPQPAERVALEVMLAAQLAASAMLFPLVLRDAPASLAAIASAWVMLQFAGWLGGNSLGQVFIASLGSSAWMV